MKLLFIPTLNPPVVFYRMEQNVKELRRLGHEVAFSYRGYHHLGSCQWEQKVMTDQKILETFEQLFSICDMAVIQPVHTREACALLHLMKDRHKKPMFIELDDDPYSVTPMAPTMVRPGSDYEMWMDEHARLSDGVIAATPYLAERFKQTLGKPTHVVPNAINLKLYDGLKWKQSKKPLAGWVGGAGHRLDLRIIEDVPKELPNVRFDIFSGHLHVKQLKHPNVRQFHMTPKLEGDSPPPGRRWWRTVDQYPKWMASLGLWVGLAPLVDNVFNRAKSNLRFLEYAALKIPTVASNVEPFRNTIEHGKNGFLADPGTDDWARYIEVLVEDDALREEMGTLARDKIRDEFNVSDVAKKYEGILKEYV